MISKLEFGLHQSGLPLIAVNLFNYGANLLIDTGSNMNLIDQQVYEYFKDALPEPTEEVQNIETFYGIVEGNRIDVPFSFENQEYEESFVLSALIAGISQRVYDDSGMEIHGILGNNFLMKHEWVLDFKNKEIYKQ